MRGPFSLWKVHPITAVHVCMTANKQCDPKKVKAPQWNRPETLKD